MKPDINVTPLIDVLLVLLIIFMVIAPIKPSQFETKIPSENKTPANEPHPDTLIVRINSDSTLALNNEENLGSISEPTKLSKRLDQIFAKRLQAGVFRENLSNKDDLPLKHRIQKTVFVKAPKSLAYGDVVKVIDEIKIAGANPISLQIDDLN